MLIRRAKTSECAALLRGAYGRRPGVGFGRRGGFRGFGGGAPPLLNLATGGTFTRTSEAFAMTGQGTGTWLSSNQRRITNPGFYGAASGGTAVYLEGAATNLCLQSEDFANAVWLNFGSPNVTSNTTTAIDGDTDADTIEDDNAAAFEGRYQTISVSLSTNYALSVFVKKDSTTDRFPELGMSLPGPGANIGSVQLNTSTGATATRGTVVAFGAQDLGTWWRLWCVVNTGANASVDIRVFPAFSATLGGVDNTATGTAIFWGAQTEAGSFPTSYIRTTTASATRAADTLTFASIPVRMREGKWRMAYWPLRASGEGSGGLERPIHSATPDSLLYGGLDQLQFADGGVARFSDVKGWSRLSKITHVVDMAGLTVDHTGYSSGNAQDTGAASTWDDATFRVGGASGGSAEFFGFYANIEAA